MSDSPRSPSRRAVLRALSAAPLAILACNSRGTESKSEITELVKGMKLDLASSDKLDRIADRLWTVFRFAVGDDDRIATPVLAKGWELSSSHVISKIDEFPSSGMHNETDVCAFKCGLKARDLAGTGQITADIFEKAWKHTSQEIKEIMKRIGGDDDKVKVRAYAC